MSGPRIGLAFSGGGFRATCFGLGCLRALHDQGVLPRVTVISGISGGSLIAAMYAYGPKSFGAFDAQVVDQLRRGIQFEIIMRALQPDALVTNVRHSSRLLASIRRRTPQLRSRNRTDALRATLASRIFGRKTMDCVTHDGLEIVLSATDLISMNAIRFGSTRSSCSAYGTIEEPIEVADAVAASAAFPLGLPAIERYYACKQQPDGSAKKVPVLMTDGGVYDNLGLSVLEPGRSSDHTAHVYNIDYIIACDAGQGRPALGFGHFAPFRLKRSFDIVHRRSQNAARARLYEAVRAGTLRDVIHPYLGMPDDRLPLPTTDLIPAESVRRYPTDFRAMSPENMEAISLRGEQLTRLLLSHYCPEL
jgi:predicted acylesterase/phospholipase RssA